MDDRRARGRSESTHRRARRLGASCVVVVGTLWSAPPAGAAPGDLALASTADGGAKGNGSSIDPSLSADGTKVAFTSASTNLDISDGGDAFDVYVKDVVTGDIVLASTSSTGLAGNGFSGSPSLNATGTAVAFGSSATNFDPRERRDGVEDIYVKDLATGAITLASTSSAAIKGNGTSTAPSLSADGTRVAFISAATNLVGADADPAFDVYVKDLSTGSVVLASIAEGGPKVAVESFSPSLSGDGTRVAFVTLAALDPADQDGASDVYVKDLVTGDLVLASTAASGAKANGFSSSPSMSGDGDRVAFATDATNLDPSDVDGTDDVYVKELSTGALALASTSELGAKGDGESDLPSLSTDGSRVAFLSAATNLDPADADSMFDVYVKDLGDGDVTLSSTTAAGIKAGAMSFAPSLSGGGSSVAFQSAATNLDPADGDATDDVYVKEIAGSEPPPAVTVSAGDTTAVEGTGGRSLASFELTLSAPAAGSVTVTVSTRDGTAIAPSDYAAKVATVTFAPGQTSAAFVVVVRADVVDEPDEHFFADLSDPAGATIGDAEGRATIVDDD